MLFTSKNAELCVMYSLTSLHAGSGQATGVVDLPIQRERHTGWPMVQASGVKGAFRDWFTRFYQANGDGEDKLAQAREFANKVFGREETSGDAGHAGAISLTDARMLLFPVRSSVAPFVWLICPAILERLNRDLALIWNKPSFKVPAAEGDIAIGLTGEWKDQAIVLEDLAVSMGQANPDPALPELMRRLAPQATRVLLISNQNFKFLVETATEVQPQISIDPNTGTTKNGSLRYQELLPADSVLYSMAFFSAERTKEASLQASQIRERVKEALGTHVQLGGDMTMGHGIMELNWLGA